MSSRTNSILRYVRPSSVWLCPDCDAENELTETSCFLCGCGKTVSAVIVNPVDNFDYNETDKAEYKGAAANTLHTTGGGSTFSSPGFGFAPESSTSTGVITHGGLEATVYTTPEEKKRNPVLTIFIALIITVGLALLGIMIYSLSSYNHNSSQELYVDEEYVENSESSDVTANYYSEIN